MNWHNGRYTLATQRHSPNYEVRAADETISLIVLHNISLPPFEYGSDAVEQLFTNQILADAEPFLAQLMHLRVSSHFFIRRTGEIQQYVSCDDMAYHAGISQFCGREKCNHFSIGIELEGCDFEPFAEAQYGALNILLAEICAKYPIRAITGHQHIAPSRKTDPGHFFDWQRVELQELVDFN
ncbi:1,6-anhydro-N-acetylmuramyl-L-alanine amidase AmpD [Neisseriaceae bacterium B1]